VTVFFYTVWGVDHNLRSLCLKSCATVSYTLAGVWVIIYVACAQNHVPLFFYTLDGVWIIVYVACA
jgi:hypothetical protein